ncbi:MAG: cation transporter [Myxococcales bacterium]|nr:cation transporter [Myxococcales bacterium]
MSAPSTPVSNATSCGCAHVCVSQDGARQRRGDVGRALRLEYLTVGWNVVEGLIAVTAALAAGSIALLGFGLDSFVECASGLVMIWRLRSERADHSPEDIEHRARRLVALSLFVLAAYVAFEAARSLWTREHPSPSTIGLVLTAISAAVMVFLARAKRRAAAALESRALEADAFQTTACWWLSIATLAGIGLNAALGWWWADPVAALVIAALVTREAKESWEGRECC